jgi:hypothetical protein
MIGNTHQRNVTHAEISSRILSHVTTFRKVFVVSVQTASMHMMMLGLLEVTRVMFGTWHLDR